jgi:CPA1 family monovalent cation:H+ antiporter
MHEQLPFILALIAAIVLIEMLATRLRIAYPVLLVVAGLLISFVPGLPKVQVDPDMIFFIFLPPLLFEAAWSISFKEMKKWWRIIGSFAFLVVFFSALSVALFANYFIPGFTLALGFLLGGIVSPPDAVSTGAIMKFVKVPKSTSAILEGESLLNDASSLIIFKFALLAVGTGQFIFGHFLANFSWMIVGGIAIGLIFGWIFMQAHKLLPTTAASDIAFTLIEPYFLYWIAEHLNSSGVLAVVTGGLFLANRRLTFLSSGSRISGYSFWDAYGHFLRRFGNCCFNCGKDYQLLCCNACHAYLQAERGAGQGQRTQHVADPAPAGLDGYAWCSIAGGCFSYSVGIGKQ